MASYLCVYLCTYMSIYVHIYAFVYMSVYICVHVYIDAFVCIPMHTFELRHIYGHIEGKRDGNMCNRY